MKILVAEDSPLYTKAISKIFENPLKYELFYVSNEKSAKKEIKENNFDLILLDLNLEEGNGMEVLKFLRGELMDNNTYVIAVTSETREELIEKMYNLGMDYYIRKPFSPTLLKALADRIYSRLENIKVNK